MVIRQGAVQLTNNLTTNDYSLLIYQNFREYGQLGSRQPETGAEKPCRIIHWKGHSLSAIYITAQILESKYQFMDLIHIRVVKAL